MKLRKGDNVQIITGKDRGKRGKVVEVDIKNNKVLVSGVNLYKKHQRPKKAGEKGEIITTPKYLSVSNAGLVCSSCDRAVRIGYRLTESVKVRYCKKCQAVI